MQYAVSSHAENAFFRYKRTFGGGLHAKRDASQEQKVAIAWELLNRMLDLDRPQSYPAC